MCATLDSLVGLRSGLCYLGPPRIPATQAKKIKLGIIRPTVIAPLGTDIIVGTQTERPQTQRGPLIREARPQKCLISTKGDVGVDPQLASRVKITLSSGRLVPCFQHSWQDDHRVGGFKPFTARNQIVLDSVQSHDQAGINLRNAAGFSSTLVNTPQGSRIPGRYIQMVFAARSEYHGGASELLPINHPHAVSHVVACQSNALKVDRRHDRVRGIRLGQVCNPTPRRGHGNLL